MPSSTVNERTTNVKVAGNLKGLSADATSRSSPAGKEDSVNNSEPRSRLISKIQGFQTNPVCRALRSHLRQCVQPLADAIQPCERAHDECEGGLKSEEISWLGEDHQHILLSRVFLIEFH